MPTEQKKHKVTVVAPSEGKWAGGTKWNGGSTEAEITEDQLVSIAAREDVKVYMGGKRVKALPPPPTTHTVETLTPDEARALQEYRAERIRNPKLAEESTAKRYELVADDSQVAPRGGGVATAEPQPIVSDDRPEGHQKRK